MKLAEISHKFEEKLEDSEELKHLLDLNETLNVFEHDGIVYIQLGHSVGNGVVISKNPVEFDREYNFVAQTIFDRNLKCLTINDDSYDTDDKVSVKELIGMLKSELSGKRLLPPPRI